MFVCKKCQEEYGHQSEYFVKGAEQVAKCGTCSRDFLFGNFFDPMEEEIHKLSDIWKRRGIRLDGPIEDAKKVKTRGAIGLHGYLPKDDVVNHPSHYTDGKIEVIDFIEDKGFNYHLGNAVKYLSRSGKKDKSRTIEDLEKAAWYINREIERLGNG